MSNTNWCFKCASYCGATYSQYGQLQCGRKPDVPKEPSGEKDNSVVYWKGKNISDMSKDQLIQVIVEQKKAFFRQLQEHTRTMERLL